MTLLDRILNPIRKTVSSLIQRIGSVPVYSEINSQRAIEKGFQSNTAVYSIVMKDAEKFASIPRYVYDAKETEEKAAIPAAMQALTDLINRPNESESQDAFLAKVRAYFKVCGEAFIWLNRGDAGVVVDESGELVEMDSAQYAAQPVMEMIVLPSDKITVIPSKDDMWAVESYILEAGIRIPIRKEDIIHWKATSLKFDPVTRSQLRGLSPLTAGYKTLEQNNSVTDASVRMYQNDGAKGLLFNETLDKLNPQQKSQIDDVIAAKINGNDLKGAIAAMQGKWGYLDFGRTAADLNLIEGKNLSWKELCFLMSVPYELFDTQTTFANKEQAQNGWVSNSVIPACKQLDGELNRALLKAFGLVGLAYIGSDFTDLLEAQRDLALTITALAQAWWMTPNEKREWMNQEKSDKPEFDEPWIPSGIEPLSQIVDGGQNILDQVRQRGLLNDAANE